MKHIFNVFTICKDLKSRSNFPSGQALIMNCLLDI